MNADLKRISDELWEMPRPIGLYAGDLFDRGSDYLSAFKELANVGPPRHRHAESFLLVHAIELFLKAYLVARGVTKIELGQGNLGHNLAHVLDACEMRQMPSVEMLRPLCNQLAEMNARNDLRYPSAYIIRIPTPDVMVPIVDALAATIEPVVCTARIQAQLQFSSDTRHVRGANIRWSD